MNTDRMLRRLAVKFSIYKIRFNRLRDYLGVFNFILLLSIKFEGRQINYFYVGLGLCALVVFMVFDKKYLHRQEINYINSKNDYVRFVRQELKEIKEMLVANKKNSG